MVREIKERDEVVMMERVGCPIRRLPLEDTVFGLFGWSGRRGKHIEINQ